MTKIGSTPPVGPEQNGPSQSKKAAKMALMGHSVKKLKENDLPPIQVETAPTQSRAKSLLIKATRQTPSSSGEVNAVNALVTNFLNIVTSLAKRKFRKMKSKRLLKRDLPVISSATWSKMNRPFKPGLVSPGDLKTNNYLFGPPKK